jgi:hypothetical protein
VSVALGIQHETLMHHTAICGLPGSTTFFPNISQKARFTEKEVEHKMCVLIFYTTFV